MSKPIQALVFYLANPIDASQTTIQVRGLKDSRGVAITAMPSGVTLLIATIEPRSPINQETISFTGITDNGNGFVTLTGVTRNLNTVPPFTALSPLVPHGSNVEMVISDSGAFFNTFLKADENATISALFNFTTTPQTTNDPVNGNDLARRSWILGIINGGAISTDKIVEVGIAGETISIGQPVYLNTADGRWYRAIGTTAATVQGVQLGIAQGAGTAGVAITNGVLRRGVDTNQSGGSVGLAYISNTSTIATTAGTVERVIGVFLNATTVVFDPAFYYTLTSDQKMAMAGGGDLGSPSTLNKFLTELIVSASGIDQSQVTQNSSVEVGEANATLKKNKIAQSFIPAKRKIRSVSLYKSADTGTFIGTVKIALQVDAGGNPSGVDLASVTLTNLQWLSLPIGDFEAVFSSEYDTLTPQSTYHIVVTPSTSDNSNHPNLGTNSAGGYASGGVKYNNTTDGWVAISAIDLYFKINEGNISQLVKTNSSGKIESAFFDPTKLPLPAFNQRIEITETNSGADANETDLTGSGSNQDGSVVYTLASGTTNGNLRLKRYVRDAITGMYRLTHAVTSSVNVTGVSSIVVVGSFIYVFFDGGTNVSGYRYSAADLTGETLLTLPTMAATGANTQVAAWTDGVSIYVWPNTGGASVVYQLSISGTTLSTMTTGTPNSAIYSTYVQAGVISDGKNIYLIQQTNPGTFTTVAIHKLGDVFATSVVTTTMIFNVFNVGNVAAAIALLAASIDANRFYIGKITSAAGNSTPLKNFLELSPFTKP